MRGEDEEKTRCGGPTSKLAAGRRLQFLATWASPRVLQVTSKCNRSPSVIVENQKDVLHILGSSALPLSRKQMVSFSCFFLPLFVLL